MVALQAQKKADLRTAAVILKAREVRLATAAQLREVTGCGFGELPPFGKPFNVPLLMDRDLMDEAEIYFNIGDLSRSMALDPQTSLSLSLPSFSGPRGTPCRDYPRIVHEAAAAPMVGAALLSA